MKKIQFFILTAVLSLMYCIPVFANNTADSNVDTIMSYLDTNDEKDKKFLLQRVTSDMRTVYFEEEGYFWIIQGQDVSFYSGVYVTSSLPRDFYSSHKHDPLEASSGSPEGYIASYSIYYHMDSGQSIKDNMSGLATSFDFTYASKADFFAELAKYTTYEEYLKKADEQFAAPYDGKEGRLPMLSFKVNQAFTVADLAGVKYTWSWSVSEHDIYADNPNRYKLQMVASSSLEQKTTLGTTSIVTTDIGFINENCKVDFDSNIPIYKESYSFLDVEVKKALCEAAGCDSKYSNSGVYYYLFVRVIDPESENCSLWKVYKCQGRIVTPMDIVYDEDGNAYNIEDEDMDNEAPNDDINYDDDPRTDAGDSPTSSFYNDGAELDAQSLLNNLEELINDLSGMPELMGRIFTWIPNSLFVLIVTSIGLLLIVGFVKLFL